MDKEEWTNELIIVEEYEVISRCKFLGCTFILPDEKFSMIGNVFMKCDFLDRNGLPHPVFSSYGWALCNDPDRREEHFWEYISLKANQNN